MILSLTLFTLGVFCYAIKELQSHGKLKGMGPGTGFWDERSWVRKWKWDFKDTHIVGKESFPGSSTVFVWLTDGYHFMQWFYIKLFILSIVLYEPLFTWYYDGGIFLGTWYAVFNSVYTVFQRKKKESS